MSRRLVLWLCVLAVPAAGIASAPAPLRPARNAIGECGETPLLLQEASFEVSAAVDLSGPKPARPVLATTARLQLQPARGGRDALAFLMPGDGSPAAGWAAVDDRGTRSREIQVSYREPPGEGPVLSITVRGLSPGAKTIRSLACAATGYPGARRVRFHVPWLKDDLPLAVEYADGRATLRRMHLAGEASTLWIAFQPPAGYRVAPPSREGAIRGAAMDIYGNLINGGGVTETTQTQAGSEPEYRFFAPELRRIPSRLQVDVLCVRGEMAQIPIRLRDVSLPATGVAPTAKDRR